MAHGSFVVTLSRHFPVWCCALLLLLSAIPVRTDESFAISEATLQRTERRYGVEARQRLLAWQELIRRGGGVNRATLDRVNHFFNKLQFIGDLVHWGQEDYWATPMEFLASGGGDCEDFAIAKFFTLRELGFPEEQLTLTYVKALRLNQAHMVLTYYATPGAEPLVLDSLQEGISPSSQRPDLLPVYSLNGTGLWLAKQRGKGKLIGGSDRLKRWRELLDKMSAELQDNEEVP